MTPLKLTIVALLPLLTLLAGTGVASARNEADAHCAALYKAISRYVLTPTAQSSSSDRLRAEVARADCDAGRHQRGISDLEDLAEDAKLPEPAPASARQR